MIIDCHGHYTTSPKALETFRQAQIRALEQGGDVPVIQVTDDEIRETLEDNQLRVQRERGVDLTLFSPRAAGMAHHVGTFATSSAWSRACNDMVHRACSLYPKQLAGVCQLPQSPGVSPETCRDELERCVSELGFVGCNLNPDPSDGHWTGLPLGDRAWYPLYEKMVELDVPAMIHVSCSCNPNFHHTGAHYLNGDTTAFMQFVQSDLFKDFPDLKVVIPHGGGAVPFHWGRFRGLAQNMGRPPVTDLLRNVFFDTCVYHQPGIELLFKTLPADNVLFASEILGAVKGIDPESGHYFDDTKRYIDAVGLDDATREKVFFRNALRVYGRLRQHVIRHHGEAALAGV
jgi:4-oxalmesaconate hydratase